MHSQFNVPFFSGPHPAFSGAREEYRCVYQDVKKAGFIVDSLLSRSDTARMPADEQMSRVCKDYGMLAWMDMMVNLRAPAYHMII